MSDSNAEHQHTKVAEEKDAYSTAVQSLNIVEFRNADEVSFDDENNNLEAANIKTEFCDALEDHMKDAFDDTTNYTIIDVDCRDFSFTANDERVRALRRDRLRKLQGSGTRKGTVQVDFISTARYSYLDVEDLLRMREDFGGLISVSGFCGPEEVGMGHVVTSPRTHNLIMHAELIISLRMLHLFHRNQSTEIMART